VIRFALFGAGRIGRVHADSIDVHPQAELAWVYDPIESAAL
jgi:myo-inositol 2-dehydrogenase / D-chiro-inositol 1-dehydrogenase